jgi:membrane-associated phospholipid phosphatase
LDSRDLPEHSPLKLSQRISRLKLNTLATEKLLRLVTDMKKKIATILKKVPLELLTVALLFLISLFLFSFIVQEAVYGKEDFFDQQSIRFFAAHSSDATIAFMKRITFFGSSTFLLPAYIVLIIRYLLKKDVQNAVEIGVIGASSTLVMFGLKEFFRRQRPEMPIIKGISGYSFPSGHALSSFIFFTILAHLVWQENLPAPVKYLLTVCCMLCAVLIGVSRLVLNVHYATDVIGGLCLGIIWVIVSFAVLKRFRKSNGNNGSAGTV